MAKILPKIITNCGICPFLGSAAKHPLDPKKTMYACRYRITGEPGEPDHIFWEVAETSPTYAIPANCPLSDSP